MTAAMPEATPERIAALHEIRDRHPGPTSAPQRARVLEALEKLGHLTTFEGTRHLDAYDVRARVLELRKEGHPRVRHQLS